MTTTDTLIATICADAQADLERDPQAVIRRLKQDLRAARQAATKARTYAERIRDGHRDPELDVKLAELEAAIARRDETIRTGRAAFARATRRAINAERERDALDAEIARLRAPGRDSDSSESEPDTGRSIYELQYIELMRAARIVRHLLTVNDGELAPVGNRLLAKIAELCNAVEPSRKGGRAA